MKINNAETAKKTNMFFLSIFFVQLVFIALFFYLHYTPPNFKISNNILLYVQMAAFALLALNLALGFKKVKYKLPALADEPESDDRNTKYLTKHLFAFIRIETGTIISVLIYATCDEISFLYAAIANTALYLLLKPDTTVLTNGFNNNSEI